MRCIVCLLYTSFLVRHTSLDIAPNICYGQSDVAISENFEAERLQLQKKLLNLKFDAIYTSPLQRCQHLAEALCKDSSLGFANSDIKPDARLKELHFGDWELCPWDAIPRDVFDLSLIHIFMASLHTKRIKIFDRRRVSGKHP